MQAVIQHRRSNWKNRFRLSPADGLISNHADPSEFDSTLEENFATRWGSDSHDGWTMIREGEVLHADQKVFVPDFVFRHESGVRVLMEIVGFWTPEYLVEKRKTLRLFRDHKFLLVVSSHLDWPEDESNSTPDLIRYKTSIRVSDVVDQLNRRLLS